MVERSHGVDRLRWMSLGFRWSTVWIVFVGPVFGVIPATKGASKRKYLGVSLIYPFAANAAKCPQHNVSVTKGVNDCKPSIAWGVAFVAC
jgi:hypothetical protein